MNLASKTMMLISAATLAVLADSAVASARQAQTTSPESARPANLDFEGEVGQEGLPAGWVLWGPSLTGYKVTTDASVARSGKQSVKMVGPANPSDSFVGFGQGLPADLYRGKRVRLSGYLRTQGVGDRGAGLCLRVDGPGIQPLAFDNMSERPVVGTTDWKRYEIVLEVSSRATGGVFGAVLADGGTAWVDDLKLEVVGADIPTTDMIADSQTTGNLDFEGGADGDGVPFLWNNYLLYPPTGGNGYAAGIDTTRAHAGEASGKLERTKPGQPARGEFGTLTQMMLPDEYRGKRLRYSGYVRINRVSDGHAGLWLRIDGPIPRQSLAFDNMRDRGLTGTRRWKLCEVVLDVPEEATLIVFGALLTGTGRMWVDDLKFEVVGKDVPVTGNAADADEGSSGGKEGPFGGKEVEVDPRVLDDYVGKFRVAGIIFEFFKENDRLVVSQSGVQGKLRIYAESETTFFYKVVDAKFTFVRNEQGKVERVVLHQFGQDIPGERIE